MLVWCDGEVEQFGGEVEQFVGAVEPFGGKLPLCPPPLNETLVLYNNHNYNNGD